MRQLAYLALPLMLAACNGDAPGGDGEALAPEEPQPLAEATLDLQATGIIVPPQSGFEQLDVPFGSNRAATEATLVNVLGAPTATNGDSGDCWLSTITFDGITLSFNAEEQFVGYYATDPYVPALTRAEMLEDPMVSLYEESTLGEEFQIGSEEAMISGMFTGEGDDAVVESLWAGENCIYR